MIIIETFKKVAQSRQLFTLCWIAVAAAMGISAPVYAGPALQADFPLWEKATVYMSRNHWIPGKLSEHKRIYDIKGKLVELSHALMELSPEENGAIRLRLIDAEENGKDVTTQARKAASGEMTFDELFGESPFLTEKGKKVTLKTKGRNGDINGRPCTAIKFVMYTKKAAVEGTAWLDRSTGLPIEIHSAMTSAPFMEEDVLISGYRSSEYFAITPQGNCMLIRSLAKVAVEIPQLRFKGRVVTERVANDHWRYARRH